MSECDLLVGIPIHGDDVKRWFWDSWCKTDWPSPFAMVQVQGSNPVGARNRLADIAVEDGFKWLLYVDCDQAWGEDYVKRLLAHDVDIVGAWSHTRYPGESRNHPICVYSHYDEHDEGWQTMEPPPERGLQEVEAIGFGMTLVRVDIFNGISRPWFYIKDWGEDITFCANARLAGHKVHVDWNLPLTHGIGGACSVDGKIKHL
jgi:hypothetical protein